MDFKLGMVLVWNNFCIGTNYAAAKNISKKVNKLDIFFLVLFFKFFFFITNIINHMIVKYFNIKCIGVELND